MRLFALGHYFAALLIMLLLRICSMVESYTVRKGRKRFSELMNIRPEYANVETAEGVLSVSPDYVNVGDIIAVQPGERIPLDGVIIDGITTIDCSPLAGKTEARSRNRRLQGPLRLHQHHQPHKDKGWTEAMRIPPSAGYSVWLKSRRKTSPGRKKLIAVFGKYFSPAVIAAAVLIALVPPIFNGQWLEYLHRAAVFLMVSCPSAMTLSVPLAYFVGMGCAVENGVLIKGFSYLESLANADTFVFERNRHHNRRPLYGHGRFSRGPG